MRWTLNKRHFHIPIYGATKKPKYWKYQKYRKYRNIDIHLQERINALCGRIQYAPTTTARLKLSINFQIINFTRPEGGDNTNSISPTDNLVKLFMWKSITQTLKSQTIRSEYKKNFSPIQKPQILCDLCVVFPFAVFAWNIIYHAKRGKFFPRKDRKNWHAKTAKRLWFLYFLPIPEVDAYWAKKFFAPIGLK